MPTKVMGDLLFFFCFFFNDTATTEIYTLSLHDALPICSEAKGSMPDLRAARRWWRGALRSGIDRKSTRLNSRHGSISYAVFCFKNKSTPDEMAKKHTSLAGTPAPTLQSLPY